MNGIMIDHSYINIPKFSKHHFGYYHCENENLRKTLVLSPKLFELIRNVSVQQRNQIKYNRSFIELIKGKYVGNNITLICRIGRGHSYFS